MERRVLHRVLARTTPRCCGKRAPHRSQPLSFTVRPGSGSTKDTTDARLPIASTQFLPRRPEPFSFSSFSSSASSSPDPYNDPAEIGRTIQILTSRLPFLLQQGSLPMEILSETVTLELLPTTLGLPEIKGRTAYTTLLKLSAWSVGTLIFPRARMVIDSQRLIGSARRCERMTVRFRLVAEERSSSMSDADATSTGTSTTTTTANDGSSMPRGGDASGLRTLYTGLFHFHFDSRGKISRHVFEVVDDRFTPAHLVDWLVGSRKFEKNLGYCYESYERRRNE